jgi:hypothetical protein
MTEKGPKAQAGAAAQAAAAERQRRSAEALRTNLRRRKGQARDRAEDVVEEQGRASDSDAAK